MGPKDTPPGPTPAEKAREVMERIEKNELMTRDLEAQARVFEARIRIAEVRAKSRGPAAAHSEEE